MASSAPSAIRPGAHARTEMPLEPARGQFDHHIERAGLWEQMGCTRNDLDRFRRLQTRQGPFVEFDHFVIEAADNQQGRCSYILERRICQIGAAASRHYGTHPGAKAVS